VLNIDSPNNINISYSFENVVPYYLFNDKMNPENSHKGFLGEWSFREGCEDYLTVSNIEYSGKHDIDNIVFTSIGTVINESKNISKDFKISYSWFLTHILDRFLAYPIAQYYARLLGYPEKTIFLLTIPSLKCDKKTELAIRGIGIRVLQTNKQALNKTDVKRLSLLIRSKFPSVLTNNVNYNNGNNNNGDTEQIPETYDEKEANEVYECINSIRQRANNKCYVTFSLDELRRYFTIKNNYIANKTKEPIFYNALYGFILKYAVYNWTSLCKFCTKYPCDYIEHYNGVKDGNFYLLKDTDQSQVYMNVINKIHKCLRKKLYLFFFKSYPYFNTSIQEDRTVSENKKNPQTTITDYIGDAV
jgi:hypothetical protein